MHGGRIELTAASHSLKRARCAHAVRRTTDAPMHVRCWTASIPDRSPRAGDDATEASLAHHRRDAADLAMDLAHLGGPLPWRVGARHRQTAAARGVAEQQADAALVLGELGARLAKSIRIARVLEHRRGATRTRFAHAPSVPRSRPSRNWNSDERNNRVSVDVAARRRGSRTEPLVATRARGSARRWRQACA